MPRLRRPVVLLTRPDGENDALATRLGALDVAIEIAPCVRLAPLADPAPLRDAVQALGPDDVLAVTSRAGARAVAEAIGSRGCAASLAAVGASTATACRALGLRVAFVPTVPSGAGLAAELPLPAGRVLLARADRASDDLPLGLRARGAEVGEIVAYRTTPIAPDRSSGPDVVVFASPSAVDGFALGGPLGQAIAVAIGTATAARVRDALGADAVIAARPDDAALAAAVISALEERHALACR